MARRRRQSSNGAGLLLMFGIAGLIALGWLARFARHNLALCITIAVVWVGTALVLGGRYRRRGIERDQDRLRAVMQFHEMNDKQFEHALASLCRAGGCRDTEVVGGAGDHAADVKAVTPDGRRLILQAKRYNIRNPVGDKEMQQTVGGLSTWHQFDIAVMVTTSTFTKSARATAARTGIRLVDNGALAKRSAGTGPAPWD